MEENTRPWGRWIKLADNERCTVKILEINPGEQLSFQSHKLRDEFWYLISGKARVHLAPVRNNWQEIEPELKQTDLSPGSNIRIEKNMVHSAENTGTGNEPCRILEISTGEFREDDETRWKDRYERG